MKEIITKLVSGPFFRLSLVRFTEKTAKPNGIFRISLAEGRVTKFILSLLGLNTKVGWRINKHDEKIERYKNFIG